MLSDHSQTECTKELLCLFSGMTLCTLCCQLLPLRTRSDCLQLLTEPYQCYLVLLTATAGMTFRGKQSKQGLPQAATPEETQQASGLAADEQTPVSAVYARDCGHPATCMHCCSMSTVQF